MDNPTEEPPDKMPKGGKGRGGRGKGRGKAEGGGKGGKGGSSALARAREILNGLRNNQQGQSAPTGEPGEE